jgi:hypothetical protein
LPDGLGRGKIEISDTFGKGLGSHGRDLVAEERNFGNTENTLGRVQEDTVLLELVEEGAEVLVVLFRRMAKEKNIVNVGETEIQVLEDTVYETLEGLGGVP